eukprot:Selendium_serpulae@DN6459_c0_g1_i1.p1
MCTHRAHIRMFKVNRLFIYSTVVIWTTLALVREIGASIPSSIDSTGSGNGGIWKDDKKVYFLANSTGGVAYGNDPEGSSSTSCPRDGIIAAVDGIDFKLPCEAVLSEGGKVVIRGIIWCSPEVGKGDARDMPMVQFMSEGRVTFALRLVDSSKQVEILRQNKSYEWVDQQRISEFHFNPNNVPLPTYGYSLLYPWLDEAEDPNQQISIELTRSGDHFNVVFDGNSGNKFSVDSFGSHNNIDRIKAVCFRHGVSRFYGNGFHAKSGGPCGMMQSELGHTSDSNDMMGIGAATDFPTEIYTELYTETASFADSSTMSADSDSSDTQVTPKLSKAGKITLGSAFLFGGFTTGLLIWYCTIKETEMEDDLLSDISDVLELSPEIVDVENTTPSRIPTSEAAGVINSSDSKLAYWEF